MCTNEHTNKYAHFIYLALATEPLPVRHLFERRVQTEEVEHTRALVTHEELACHAALAAVVVMCICKGREGLKFS